MGQGGLGEVETPSPLAQACPGNASGQARRRRGSAPSGFSRQIPALVRVSKFSPNFYLAETSDFNALRPKKFGIGFLYCWLPIGSRAPEGAGDSQGNIDLDFQKGFVEILRWRLGFDF
jgi:hypothetical protein